MLLRIEDTDTERNRPELTDDILAEIEWLGLAWTASRSTRATGCTFTPRPHPSCRPRASPTGATARRAGPGPGEAAGRPAGYDGHCRDRGLAQGPGTALRFRAPDVGTTSFEDLVRGTVTFGNDKIEDFVLLRSNGIPTFLLANVVDDVDMGITHVVRGEEHVNGTPKYLLIGDASASTTGRCSPTCRCWWTSGARSCPSGATATCRPAAEFRQAGYLPEAMVNYLATLGACPTAWRSAARRDRRPVRPRGGHPVARLLRHEEADPLQRRVHPGARHRRVRGPGAPVLRPRRRHRGGAAAAGPGGPGPRGR